MLLAPDVAGLTGLHDVVQRLHRLFDRSQRIEAVDLVQVDVVHLEPRERCVDGCHHVLAREAAPVRSGRHGTEELGRDDELFA
jgi:hypothetical protein